MGNLRTQPAAPPALARPRSPWHRDDMWRRRPYIDRLSRLGMVDRYYNHVSHTLLVMTTRAIRKFVQEHDGVQVPVLDQILASLEADDFKAASKLFKTIQFGAYG